MQKRSFFLPVSFPKKAFVFQTIESAKCAFASRTGSGEPAFLQELFFEIKKKKKKKTAEKFTGQCFPVIKVQGHSSFRGPKKKKKGLKSHFGKKKNGLKRHLCRRPFNSFNSEG